MKRLPQLLTCLALLLAVCLFAPHAEAKTLTWAADADINSLDPHARDETFTLGFPEQRVRGSRCARAQNGDSAGPGRKVGDCRT